MVGYPVDPQTTLEQLLNEGWQVIKRGHSEYFTDAENAILRTHVRLHYRLRDAIARWPGWTESKASKLGFMKVAGIAFESAGAGAARALGELSVLNGARNMIAHEWSFVPRFQKVLELFRIVLQDVELPDLVPSPEVSIRFIQQLGTWEESILERVTRRC